jgi:hypothetical protein
MEDKKYLHTTIDVDDRCLDLLLTPDEINESYHRSLNVENSPYIDMDKCCKCWPAEKPRDCSFWRKLLNICPCNCKK